MQFLGGTLFQSGRILKLERVIFVKLSQTNFEAYLPNMLCTAETGENTSLHEKCEISATDSQSHQKAQIASAVTEGVI